MRVLGTSLSGRRGARVGVAAAALGLAVGLAACTIGDPGDDDGGTAADPTTQATAAEPADGDSHDSPDVGVDHLVLTAEDMPEFGWQAVPAADVSGGLDVLEGFAESVRVDPEHCADVNQEEWLDQAEPGTMAIQAGQFEGTSYAVAVTTATDDLPGRADQVQSCPVMTITFPMGDDELTTEARNTLLDLDAPAGVEEFAAVAQENSVDMMGQQLLSGSVIITGVVRGIGVSVTAAGTEGPVTEEARDTAMGVFDAQVEKIRSA